MNHISKSITEIIKRAPTVVAGQSPFFVEDLDFSAGKNPFRSTNVTGDAGPQGPGPGPGAVGFPPDPGASTVTKGAPSLLQLQGEMLLCDDEFRRIAERMKKNRTEITCDFKRNALDTALRGKGIDPKRMDKDKWSFVKIFKTAAMAYEAMARDKDTYREYRYRGCHWMDRKGTVIIAEGGGAYWQDSIPCQERLCFKCEKKRKRNVSREWLNRFQAMAYADNKNFPGLMDIVFTLPRNVEDAPLRCSSLEKRLLDEIHNIIRQMFGLGTRANIGILPNIHAVGSSDMYRDRWHVHVKVFPAVVEADLTAAGEKTGTFTRRWVKPVWTNGKNENPFLDLDFSHLRDAWKAALVRNFPTDEIPAQIQNVQYNFALYNDTIFNHESEYWTKVSHGLRYNNRSFVEDFENGAIRSDAEMGLVLRQAGLDWRTVSGEEEVERYLWVRGKTKGRARGFLNSLRKHRDSLGLVYDCQMLVLPWTEEKQEEEVKAITAAIIHEINDAVLSDPPAKRVEMMNGSVMAKDRAALFATAASIDRTVIRKREIWVEYIDPPTGKLISGPVSEVCAGKWRGERWLRPLECDRFKGCLGGYFSG